MEKPKQKPGRPAGPVKKVLNLRLSDDTVLRIRKLAEKERRSMCQMAELLIEKGL